MLNLTRTADYLAKSVQAMGFQLMSKTGGEGLPLVAFRLDPARNHRFDEFALAHQLRERGWVVPAYTMAPHANKLKMMRVVIREDFSRSRCDSLVSDIQLALQELIKLDEKNGLDAYQNHIQAHHAKSGKTKHMNTHFANEKHSLQGKHGKTHAVC